MSDKLFRLAADQIAPLVTHPGGCIASDRITVDGSKVGYMYREETDDPRDSGWRFLAGDESDAYMDEPKNHAVYAINTIANYDPDIIPFLSAPDGSAFERENGTGPFIAAPPPPSEEAV